MRPWRWGLLGLLLISIGVVVKVERDTVGQTPSEPPAVTYYDDNIDPLLDVTCFGANFTKLAIGAKKGHHSLSHSSDDKTRGAYDRWLCEQFAYFLEQMKTFSNEHGPLLSLCVGCVRCTLLFRGDR